MEHDVKLAIQYLAIVLKASEDEVEELVEELIFRSKQGVRVMELLKRVKGQS